MKRFLPILVVVLTSCELVVDVKIPDDNANRLVTNAVQDPDSLWQVKLTRSNNILSVLRGTFFPVDFADVTLYHPDGTSEPLELVRAGSGTFKGKTYPQPGERYKIIVSARNLETVESEMTMPSRVSIVDIEFDSSNVEPASPIFHSVDLPFTVVFNDPPGEKNFYKIEVYYSRRIEYGPPGQPPMADTLISRSVLTIKDPAIATEDDRRDRFTDESFDGTTYRLPVEAVFYSFGQQQRILWVEIRFVSMSEDYYRYEESADLSSDVRGDPFAQPVQVYSNVSNGFGIFAGGEHDKRRYDLKDP